MFINDGYIIVMFDISVRNREEAYRYRLFRKRLYKKGYSMLQKSVYTKYIRDMRGIDDEANFIMGVFPCENKLHIIKMTADQFGKCLSSNEDFNASFERDRDSFVSY